MNASDDFLGTLDTATRYEKSLRKYILGTWGVGSLIQIAQVGKFDPPFLALSNVLVFTAASAAVFGVYLESYRHPAEELDQLLFFRPRGLALRIVLGLGGAMALFAHYYHLAGLSNRWCLAPLCIGVFLLSWTTLGTLLDLMTLQRQKKLWAALSPEDREALKTWEKDVLGAVKQGEEVLRGFRERLEKPCADLRRIQRAKFVNRWRTRWKTLAIRTYPWRKRWGAVTALERVEEVERTRDFQNKKREVVTGLAREALKAAPQRIEGTDLELRAAAGWKFVFRSGEITLDGARAMSAALAPYVPLALALQPEATLSAQARSHLEAAGVYIVQLTP